MNRKTIDLGIYIAEMFNLDPKEIKSFKIHRDERGEFEAMFIECDGGILTFDEVPDG